jgi:zinc D-Ala-D-Ala carboxypeptidase
MPTTMLSPHFTLDEYIYSQTASRMGISNQPTPEILECLKRHAATMEQVRTLLGNKPILISSGYRSPQVNAACGGASNSAHMSGLAADWTCPGFGTPHDICLFLQKYMAALKIDQLIDEYPPTGWVHLGLSNGDPRMMALTIDNSGTKTGFA